MSLLNYNAENASRPYCVTEFGTYRVGYDPYRLVSDIRSTHGQERAQVEVFWCYLGDIPLYRGFNVEDAFSSAEADFITRQMQAKGEAA